ncbi:MAG: immunity 17 family protein [Ruminococcus sp.]|nr:immunity 17 family protein [Ruminococcus sp.]
MDKEMIIMSVVVTLIGLFPICGAIFNWNWFFNNYKARGIVRVFGRTGARIFYALIGLLLMGVGIAALVMGI